MLSKTAMSKDTPDKIRTKDLAEKLGISRPYASQLLTGARVPSLPLALEMYDKAGVQFGPLEGKSTKQIALLREALAA